MNKSRQFVIGAAVTIIATSAGYLISPIEVRYLETLTNNTALIGAAFSIASISFGLLTLWLGRLTDKLGRNRFIVFGAAVGIVYPLLLAFAINIFQYMGIKFAGAFAVVCTGPILMAQLQQLVKDDDDKAHKMSLIFSMQSLGGAIAMFIGGFLGEKYGITAPYYALSLSFIFVTVLAYEGFGFENTRNESHQDRGLLFSFEYVRSRPKLIYYFMISSVFYLNFYIKYMLYPLIIYELTSSNLLTGAIMGTQGVVAFFILLFAGKLVKKIGLFKMIIISFSLLAVFGNVLSLANMIVVFWIAAGLFAAGEAMLAPIQQVFLIDNVEDDYRGEINGLNVMVGMTLGSISTILAGFLMKSISPQQVLLIYTSLYWIVMVGAVAKRRIIK